MTPERPAGAAAQPTPSRSPRRGRSVSGAEPKRPNRPDGSQLYAALDLGTNSCRMLIARPQGPQFEVVDSFSRAVELGTGLEATGRLGYGPMARTVQALRICRRKLDDHQVGRMRLVATEACRRARNSNEFIRKIQRETGLRLEGHGDHGDLQVEAPSHLPVELRGPRPSHVVGSDGRLAVFFDGDGSASLIAAGREQSATRLAAAHAHSPASLR